MNAAKPAELSAGQDQERKRRKRGAFIKFSLAGVALLGIGAAATSAAWTDDAWFSGTAHAASASLVGRVGTSGTWTHASQAASETAIVFGTTEFGQINQGANIPVTLQVENAGSVPLKVTNLTLATTGGIFTDSTTVTGPTGKGAAVAYSGIAVGQTIAPSAVVTITVTLTTDANWSSTFEGQTGTVSLDVSATS